MNNLRNLGLWILIAVLLVFLFNLGDEAARTALPAGAWRAVYQLDAALEDGAVTLPCGGLLVAAIDG